MKFTETKQGRSFIIRLEDGDILHEVLERFARDNRVKTASVMVLGGADKGSRLVVGPREGRSEVIEPLEVVLEDVYEATGNGTIVSDENGKPELHLHLACGRGKTSVAGCVRNGVKVWHIMEVVVLELVECQAARMYDPVTGFKLLKILK